MSKLLRVLPLLLMISIAFGGGMVENTNQSADFVRMMARNASTDLDAVFFNPAGLTKLDNGMHLYLSSQTVIQSRTITGKATIPGAGLVTMDKEYEGTTFVPVFPNFYFAYKMDKLVFSAGFTPIGGGGSAVFEDGVPSFEAPVSALVPVMAAAGVTGYNFDIDFNGSSTYLGGQASVAYAINDMISVSLGARFFSAGNSYKGHLKDIKVETAGGDFAPGDVMRNIAALYTGAAATATGASASMQTFIDGGFGDYNFTTIVASGNPLFTQADLDAMTAGFVALGVPGFDPDTWTPTIAQGAYNIAAATAAGTAPVYTAQGLVLDAKTANLVVDATQSGTGFAPIVGLNISLMDKLNIGIRYEGMAALELTNSNDDPNAVLYADGETSNADMPALFGVGLSYLVMPSLNVAFDYNMYFNEDVNWDGKEADVENGSEIAVGAEFALSKALLLSAGYNMATSGALDAYQTDLSYSLNSSTIGLGAKYTLNPQMAISLGFSSTAYEEGSKSGVVYALADDGVTPSLTGDETYMKTATVFAIGLQKSF